MWPFGSSNNSDKPAPAQPSPRETGAGPLQDKVEKKVVDVKNAVHDEFDPKKLPPREKLPDGLQKIIEKGDKDDSFYDELVEG